MNKLDREARSRILHLLCEGSSIRAVTRLTGASKNTVTKLLVDAGRACTDFQDRAFRNLTCKRIQVDEIWSFVGAKAANANPEKKAAGEAGDVWTWTAIDADTKLMPSWLIADRSADSALEFMLDLQGRLSNRIQLTSDGHGAYIKAVDETFGDDIDYAMLVKVYGRNSVTETRRYSPPPCIGAIRGAIKGNPDPDHISTSYAERQNLNIRMHTRRFTRLTNAFSKKVENHGWAVALFAMYYNFVRIHKTLRVTPAMAANVTDKLWEASDIVAMLEEWEAAQVIEAREKALASHEGQADSLPKSN
jgi:IS1 family transposase